MLAQHLPSTKPMQKGGARMRLLIMNCNTSPEMTEQIADDARSAARPGTEIVGMKPDWGPESAEGFYDSFITAAAVLDKISSIDMSAFDGFIMAGFGEHGKEGARQLLDIPVVDITEAGVMYASVLSHRFGIATTTESAIGQIEDSLSSIGLESRCVGISATHLPVLDAAGHDGHVKDALVARSRELIDQGAGAIVLGCAGFTGLDHELQSTLGVPVVDCVTAATSMCESLVHLHKRTSKKAAFSSPNFGKTYTGWPKSIVPARI